MKKTSFHATTSSWILAALFLSHAFLFGQTINIIRINGNKADISEGNGGGIRNGDTVTISRFSNGNWQEITKAEVVQSDFNQATVQIPQNSPPVRLGDKAEKVIPSPGQNQEKKTASSQPLKAGSSTAPLKESKTQKRAAATAPRRETRGPGSKSVKSVSRIEKRVYLGPQIGAFIPIGDMADVFDTRFGYGGMIAAQFRKNLDVCLQFFFALKKNEWSLWNLQMLGRRYLNQNILLDFGYGVAYPQYFSHGFIEGGGSLQLGICMGLSYNTPISNSVWFEIGALYQYFPNFGNRSGQFINLQGRLLL